MAERIKIERRGYFVGADTKPYYSFNEAVESHINAFIQRKGGRFWWTESWREMRDFLNSIEDQDATAKPGEPVPDADGWIPWSGGECPVGPYVRVDIRNRVGATFFDRIPSGWRWPHYETDTDIIAYRLQKPEADE